MATVRTLSGIYRDQSSSKRCMWIVQILNPSKTITLKKVTLLHSKVFKFVAGSESFFAQHKCAKTVTKRICQIRVGLIRASIRQRETGRSASPPTHLNTMTNVLLAFWKAWSRDRSPENCMYSICSTRVQKPDFFQPSTLSVTQMMHEKSCLLIVLFHFEGPRPCRIVIEYNFHSPQKESAITSYCEQVCSPLKK